MPFFGGYAPFPLRFGGGVPRIKTLYQSLNEARGTAYDTSDESNVTAETMAHARALDSAWSANRRMALQWDPLRMTDFLPRWEAILDLHPGPNDSVAARRQAVQAKFLAWAGQTALQELVEAIAGDSFVAIVYTDVVDAVPRWPANGYPTKWSSNVAHILVRVQYAPNQTEAEFWNMRRRISRTLRDFLPAWTTFDIGTFRPDGVSEGFFLDERNLNFETFRV